MTELIMSQNIGEYERGVIEGYQKGYNACKQDLEKHGHWVKPQDKDTIYACYKCSVCGSFNTQKFPYCSWCGAIMDESEGAK